MIIYKTTNLVNGKFYVGKDKRDNPSYLGSGELLKHAITKHGKDNFLKEILEECTASDADKREKFWIDFYQSRVRGIGYNIAEGGEGGDTISHHPDKVDIGNRHSKKMMGNKHASGTQWTNEMRQQMAQIKSGQNNGMWGRNHSENTKDILQLAALSRQKIECEHCGKVVDVSNFGRWHGDRCKTKETI